MSIYTYICINRIKISEITFPLYRAYKPTFDNDNDTLSVHKNLFTDISWFRTSSKRCFKYIVSIDISPLLLKNKILSFSFRMTPYNHTMKTICCKYYDWRNSWKTHCQRLSLMISEIIEILFSDIEHCINECIDKWMHFVERNKAYFDWNSTADKLIKRVKWNMCMAPLWFALSWLCVLMD